MKRELFKAASFFWICSSLLVLVSSCMGQGQNKASPSQNKGPERNPFQSCDAEDSECEEGASSDVLQSMPEMRAVAEVPSVAVLLEDTLQR